MKTGYRRHIIPTVIVLIMLFTVHSGGCHARSISDLEPVMLIISGKTVLSEDIYRASVELLNLTDQSGKITVQQLDGEGKVIGTHSYTPSAEIELEFAYSDELDSALITLTKDNETPLCDPVTLNFDKIYAADWQALATATHRMDVLYGGKVEVEDDSAEYASGRLIVKTKEDLPDVSEFDVSMMVADDEDHYFLQFETSDKAKKCAEYLKKQPEIEYVDIDSVVTVSG